MKKLFIAILCVSLVAVLLSCDLESEVSSTIETSETSNNIDVVFDVSKFANISSEELISIMGEPSGITKSVYSGFAEIPYTVYDYSNHELGVIQFDLINGKVSAFTIIGEIPYNNGDILASLNVNTNGTEIISQSDTYIKYKYLNEKVDLVHASIIDSEKDVYKSLSVKFDLEYYEEWSRQYSSQEQGRYQQLTKDTVEACLLVPESAEYPWLDWNYGKNDYYFYVSSYVHALNMFGVEIKHEFKFIYYVNTNEIAYAVLDDEVLVDAAYVPTSVLIENLVVIEEMEPEDNSSNSSIDDVETNNKGNENTNDEELLWDALAEFCNDYNSSSGEFDEVLSWLIISPTEVELYLSTDYTLNATRLSEFDALGSSVLDDICNFVDSNYYFPETITFNLTLEYYEEDTNDDGYSDNEGNWEYSDGENTDDYWTYEENDYATLVDAVNAFCNNYTCEYGTLTAEVDDNRVVVEITVTSNSGTPINDDSYSIRQKISDDAATFVKNYADFPEQITFFVWLE